MVATAYHLQLMNIIFRASLFSILGVFSTFSTPLFVFAQDSDLTSIKVCAAVMPCDEAGDVIPEFREGECYPFYKEACEKTVPLDIRMERKLMVCRESNRALRGSVSRLKKQLRHARRLARLAE